MSGEGLTLAFAALIPINVSTNSLATSWGQVE